VEPGARSLARVLSGRVEALPEAARRLLEVVSVAAAKVDVGAAVAAAALGQEAVPALRLLHASFFVRLGGLRESDSVEIYHNRIRENMVAALSPQVLVQHHIALGVAFERVAPTRRCWRTTCQENLAVQAA
jgi:hypothetical protein